MKVLTAALLCLLTSLILLACAGRASAQQPLNQLVQKGEPHVVPGCGVSGCYAPYDICVEVPAGAVPISIAHYYDSFNGWGEFTNQRQTPSGFCATYLQHSHNVTRIVSFDVLYELKNAPEVVTLPPTEVEMLARAKLGEPLRLSGSARNISGNFLQAVISQSKDSQALKARGLEIDGAEFSDKVSITKTTVPFSIHMTNCRFAKPFLVQDRRFDGSLVIEDSSFEAGCSSGDPSLYFFCGRLLKVSFGYVPEGEGDWSTWSKDRELARAATYRQELVRQLGRVGRFPWGFVDAAYDDKSAGARLFMRYEPSDS
jgi:hypothetical protein